MLKHSHQGGLGFYIGKLRFVKYSAKQIFDSALGASVFEAESSILSGNPFLAQSRWTEIGVQFESRQDVLLGPARRAESQINGILRRLGGRNLDQDLSGDKGEW